MTLFISFLIIRGLDMHPGWYLIAACLWLERITIKGG